MRVRYCGICGTSGRNASGTANCLACGGKGYVVEPDDRSTGYGYGDGSGVGLFVVVGVGLFALILVLKAYVVSTAILLHYYGGSYWDPSRESWALALFFASLAACMVASRLFGVLPGILAGLIPALPLIEGIRHDTIGFWYLSLHDAAPLQSDNHSTCVFALAGLRGSSATRRC